MENSLSPWTAETVNHFMVKARFPPGSNRNSHASAARIAACTA
jgi:hypothetical protein